MIPTSFCWQPVGRGKPVGSQLALHAGKHSETVFFSLRDVQGTVAMRLFPTNPSCPAKADDGDTLRRGLTKIGRPRRPHKTDLRIDDNPTLPLRTERQCPRKKIWACGNRLSAAHAERGHEQKLIRENRQQAVIDISVPQEHEKELNVSVLCLSSCQGNESRADKRPMCRTAGIGTIEQDADS
jgi:hypothetical protein